MNVTIETSSSPSLNNNNNTIKLNNNQTRKIKLLKQKMKLRTEYDLMFRKYLHKQCIKYLSSCNIKPHNLNEKYDIYTTRFNSVTYNQNQNFKKSSQWNGSLYSTMLSLPDNTPDKLLFVLDMNNTTNKIVGIGFIIKKLAKDQSVNIYNNPSFNHYVYKSKYYIKLIDSASASTSSSAPYLPNIEPEWIKFIETEFEDNLFYGKSNSKRVISFMRFPKKFFSHKHLLFLISLFSCINPNNFVENIFEK